MPGSGRGEYKMVLVVRGELRLTGGKAAVQVAHAAVMLFRAADRRHREVLDAWLAQGGLKQCGIPDEMRPHSH